MGGDGQSGRRLLRGADLSDAQNWRSRKKDELRPVEEAFIESSVRGSRRRRIKLTALAVALGLVVGLGTWAWRQGISEGLAARASRVLLQQSRDAEEQANPRDLGFSYTSLLLALRAYRTHDSEQTRARLGEMYARYGFADLIAPRYASQNTLLTDPTSKPPTSSLANAKAQVIASRTADDEVVVLRTDGSGVHRLPTGRDADVTAVSPDGSLVAMAKSSFLLSASAQSAPPDPRGLPVELYDVRTGKIRELERPEEGDSLSEPPDSVAGFPDLKLPDLKLPDIPGLTTPTQYARLAFAPESKVLMGQTGLFGEGGRLVFWDAASGRIKKVMPGLPESVTELWPRAGGESAITLTEIFASGFAGATTVLKLWDLSGKSPAGRELLRWQSTADRSVVMDVSPDLTRVAVAETQITDSKVSTRLAVHELPSGRLLRQERTAQQEAVSGISVAAEGSKVLAYGGANPAFGVPPSGGGPIARVDSRWGLDLLGSADDLSVILFDFGVLAVVGPENGDPVRVIPAPATSAETAKSPSATDAERWMSHLCRILSDETLPPAVAEKVPPGAYWGLLCP